jgi:hypothetical protein
MSDRISVQRITSENWQTTDNRVAGPGLLMGAYVDHDDDGFLGVWGKPGTWGYSVRCDSLEEILAWAKRERQPVASSGSALRQAVDADQLRA